MRVFVTELLRLAPRAGLDGDPVRLTSDVIDGITDLRVRFPAGPAGHR